MDFLKTYTPEIEQVSVDECYMDFTGIAQRFSSPVEAAYEIKARVYEKFGFTVNVGISTNKLLAKMASDFEKPNRVHTLFPEEVKEKMWPLPVSELFMAGKSSVAILEKLEIRTIGELAQTDPKLLEMAVVFRMPVWRKIRFIYLPALVPYLVSGCRIALGMSWKSGAAAEVIGLPEHSIGEHLYMAKIYLETADLFAWTLVIILVSAVFEQMVLFLISRLCPQRGETTHETADL